jgi:formaldehyde-activating enzyme involved in methanogenesis
LWPEWIIKVDVRINDRHAGRQRHFRAWKIACQSAIPIAVESRPSQSDSAEKLAARNPMVRNHGYICGLVMLL